MMKTMKKSIGQSTLELAQGDITALPVDAIVNAANVDLQHGGGVAWAISRKGGPKIQEESDAIIATRGPLQTGEAVITSGGNLPARFVIHTAGPIWVDQSATESDRLLRKAVRSSLALADENKLKSIAFPAISTGIYGFPVKRAARLMLDEAAGFLSGGTGLQRVIFCLYDGATYREFEEAIQGC
jgi:O-acetyl-ADP-ribose deacetylase (regulator of RNase III)